MDNMIHVARSKAISLLYLKNWSRKVTRHNAFTEKLTVFPVAVNNPNGKLRKKFQAKQSELVNTFVENHQSNVGVSTCGCLLHQTTCRILY